MVTHFNKVASDRVADLLGIQNENLWVTIEILDLSVFDQTQNVKKKACELIAANDWGQERNKSEILNRHTRLRQMGTKQYSFSNRYQMESVLLSCEKIWNQ